MSATAQPAGRATPPNVRRMYAYGLLAECLLIVPILIPLYVSRGLSATDVFLVQAVFTVGVFVFEVPSGYFADVLGRKVSLQLAALLWVLGFVAYTQARSFAGFALAELLLAVGLSLRSGTDAALVYDSLLEEGQEGEFARFQGRVEGAARLGTAAASVAGGLLGAVLLQLPVYINILTAMGMLVAAFGFREPKRPKPPYANPLRGIGVTVRKCLVDARLLVPMLLMGLMTSVGIIGLWSYLLLFQRNDLGPAATGVIFAGFQLASGLGARMASQIEGRLGQRRTWWLFAVVGVLFLVLARVPTIPVCAGVMIANAFVWGCSGPLLTLRINERASSETRATVISVGNMLGRLLYAVVAPIIGVLVDRVSLASGFLALGGFAALGVVVLVPLYFAVASRPLVGKEEAD